MDFGNHPCFSPQARHRTGRIHLPVARTCNVQCNYCDRRHDCVNETRPGVTSAVLGPIEASKYLDSVLARVGNISVVGIAGPGDPFADPTPTLETLALVRERWPEMILCLATNGLGLAERTADVIRLGVSHVTVTVNAVDPAIGAKVYAWVRAGPKVMRGVEGAAFLLERQIESVSALSAAGVTVKVNTVVIPGVNDGHVEEVARRMAELGSRVQNCVPLMRVPGTPFAALATPDPAELSAIRLRAGAYLTQLSHCARCRADAVGLVGEENPSVVPELLAAASRVGPTAERPYVAVASHEGLFVNQHLGEASGLWVFGMVDGKPSLVDRRPTPPPGSGDARWGELADVARDCFAVLAGGAGDAPARVLGVRGIKLIAMEGLAADGVRALLSGEEVPRALLRRVGSCGSGLSCGGNGMGCA